MDVEMPFLDGMAAAEMIRKTDPQVVIIFITNMASMRAAAMRWTRIGNPLEEFPEWIRPIGAHDAYDQGAKVTHNGKRWASGANGNVWEPGVYG